MCYNHSEDLLKPYGSLLLCTHLNDNLGVRDPMGKTSWLDALHLLPFDGVADWGDIVSRLQAAGFDGPLSFELNLLSKPGLHDNDKYSEMGMDVYFAEAYARACKIRALFAKRS